MSSDENEDSFEGRPKKISRKWTEQEVQDLLAGVAAARAENTDCEMSDLNWQEIAKSVPGRTAKQCREKYKNDLRDGLFKASWTRREEYIIARVHAVVGNQWSEIARYLPGRSENSIKNFFNSTLRSKVTSRSRSFLAMYGRMSVDQSHSLEVFNQAREVYTREEGDTEPLKDFEVSEEFFLKNPPQIQTQFRGNRPKGAVQINVKSISRMSGSKHALEDLDSAYCSGDEDYGTTSRRHCQNGSYAVASTNGMKRIKTRSSTAPTSSAGTAPEAAPLPALPNGTPPRRSDAGGGPQASGPVQEHSMTAQQQGSITAQQGSIQQPVQGSATKDDDVFQETKPAGTITHRANVFKGIPTPQDLIHFQMQAMNDWLQEVMPRHQNDTCHVFNDGLLFQPDMMNEHFEKGANFGPGLAFNLEMHLNESQQASDGHAAPDGRLSSDIAPNEPVLNVQLPQLNGDMQRLRQQVMMPGSQGIDNPGRVHASYINESTDMMQPLLNSVQPGFRQGSVNGFGNTHPAPYDAQRRDSSGGGARCPTPHDAFATITLQGEQQQGMYPYPHHKPYRSDMYSNFHGLPPPMNSAMHFHSNFAQALHGMGRSMHSSGMPHATHTYQQQQQQMLTDMISGRRHNCSDKERRDGLFGADLQETDTKDQVRYGQTQQDVTQAPQQLNSPLFPADGIDSLFSPDELAFLGDLLDAGELAAVTPKGSMQPTSQQHKPSPRVTHHEPRDTWNNAGTSVKDEMPIVDASLVSASRPAALDLTARHDLSCGRDVSVMTLIPGVQQSRPNQQPCVEMLEGWMKSRPHNRQADNFKLSQHALPNTAPGSDAQETDLTDPVVQHGCSTGYSSAMYKTGRRGIAGSGEAAPPSFQPLLPPPGPSRNAHTSPEDVSRRQSHQIDPTLLPSMGSLSAPGFAHCGDAGLQRHGNATGHVNMTLPMVDSPVLPLCPDVHGGGGGGGYHGRMHHADMGMPRFPVPYPQQWMTGAAPGMAMMQPHKQQQMRKCEGQSGLGQQDFVMPGQQYNGMGSDLPQRNFSMNQALDILNMHQCTFPMPGSLPSMAPPIASGLSSRTMR